MTKENAHEYLPFVQALAEGKEIEVFNSDGEWASIENLIFNAIPERYRIKPEKKLVPFTWEDRELLMGKWIVNKLSHVCAMITSISPFSVNYMTYKELFEDYMFLDGSPCGKEVEE